MLDSFAMLIHKDFPVGFSVKMFDKYIRHYLCNREDFKTVCPRLNENLFITPIVDRTKHVPIIIYLSSITPMSFF